MSFVSAIMVSLLERDQKEEKLTPPKSLSFIRDVLGPSALCMNRDQESVTARSPEGQEP